MNVLDVLKFGHRTVENSVQELSETDWETGGVCGVWSVKDILSHLTSYEHLLREILSTFLEGGETPTLKEYAQKGKGFNDDQVERRKELTHHEIWEEYARTQTEVMQLAARIPPEKYRQNGTIPWYGEEYCLDDLIVYSNYAHKREHVAQINVFRDKKKSK